MHKDSGTFVIPNPWDIGSAKLLESIGFHALATTSAGFAYARGRSDGRVTLEEVLAHCEDLARETSIPINADFENGFADGPDDVARNVMRIAETGVAGCSIEDFDRETQTLYDFTLSVERVAAAAEAIAKLGYPFQLTARVENLLRGENDLDNTILRLQAYSKAGAHVLYAPALTRISDLQIVLREIDKPFNALGPFFRGCGVRELAAAGVKRISVGSALTWATVGKLLQSSRALLEGKFDWIDGAPSGDEVYGLFKT